jgi:hypothetical protein
MLKKLFAPALALSLVAGVTLASADPAEARRGRFIAGFAAGAIGLGLLSAYAHSRPYYYYRSSCYRVAGECYWKRGGCYINRHGEEVCRRGYQVCEPSRTVCH